MRQRTWTSVIVGVVLLLTAPTHAAMVMPLNLEEITKRAEKVFVGTCAKVEHVAGPNGMPVLEVTFAVQESLKGVVGESITFRQLDPTTVPRPNLATQGSGSVVPNGIGALAASQANIPTYAVGEEAVLFLAAPGSLGLTSPIGLSQGKAPIHAMANGKRLVTNTAMRKNVGAGETLPEPGKAGNYEEFVTVLRSLVAASQPVNK